MLGGSSQLCATTPDGVHAQHAHHTVPAPPPSGAWRSQPALPATCRGVKQQIAPPSAGPARTVRSDSPGRFRPRPRRQAWPSNDPRSSRMGASRHRVRHPWSSRAAWRASAFRRPPAPKPLGVVFGQCAGDGRPPRRPMRPGLASSAGLPAGRAGRSSSSGTQRGPRPQGWPGAGRQCALCVRDAVRPAGAAAGGASPGNDGLQYTAWAVTLLGGNRPESRDNAANVRISDTAIVSHPHIRFQKELKY